jgi:hypothetical protein
MKIFGVTESELRTLSIVNAAMTALFSLGTGCFGFLLNLQASVALSDKVPAQTALLLKYAEPGLFWFGLVLYALGGLTWFMKGGFINTIKRESDPQLRQSTGQQGRLKRIWAAIRT